MGVLTSARRGPARPGPAHCTPSLAVSLLLGDHTRFVAVALRPWLRCQFVVISNFQFAGVGWLEVSDNRCG